MAKRLHGSFLPQPYVVYKKSEINSASGLNLRSSEWMVLTQVNGNQSIQEIAAVVAMSEKDVIKIMSNLFQLGLIDVHKTEKREENLLGASFFNNLENVLVKIIGPVAPFVIEDVLADINLTRTKYPSERVAELIELISDEIQDEDKKIKFQSEMLEFIKRELI